MTNAANEKLAREWLAAFNSGDWAKVKSSLADNHVYEEFGTQRKIEGAEAVIDTYQAWKKAMPDVQGIVSKAVSDDSSVLLELTWEGTQTGPLMTPAGEIPASGKKQVTPGVMAVEVQNGKLASSRNYFDMLTFLQQIGAAPGS